MDSFFKERTNHLIFFFDSLINPDRFLITDSSKPFKDKQDIRYSSGLKIVGKKIIHFLRTLFLIFTDNIALVISWVSIFKLWSNFFGDNSFIFTQDSNSIANTSYLLIMLVINFSTFFASGLYSTKDSSRRIRDSISAYSLSYITFVLIVILFDKSLSSNFSSISILTLIWLLSIFLISLERFLVFRGVEYIRSKVAPLRRKVLLVGNREDLYSSKKLFRESNTFYVNSTLEISSSSSSDEILQDIYQIFFSNDIDEVVICSWEKINEQTKVFWAFQTSGISWRILPLKQPIPKHNHELADIEGVPSIRYNTATIVGIDFLAKRFFDLFEASLLLLVFAIPMLFICLLIKLDSSGSILYKQTRVGLKGESFKVWKFRTMVENASQLQQELEAKNEVSGGILFKVADDPRITRIGKYLRRYSLDELPQLFNVLRGEMSLVGPRPLPIRDVEKFEKHHHFRHEIMPGITGLWQISGRSDISSEQVFRLDFQYIENWSLALDLKIMLKTVQVVLLSKGAY